MPGVGFIRIKALQLQKTTTNTWYVNAVGTPTGVPPPPVYDTENEATAGKFYTTNSSPSNVVAFTDTPSMIISYFIESAPNINTNDFAYEKTDFTYFLTNYIGSVVSNLRGRISL